MHKLATAALAVALGLAWSTLPAIGAGTTPKEDKTIKEKAVDAKDKVKEKTSEAWDKTKEKTSQAWDKTKEKTTEAKDKVSNKMERGDTKNAQQALQAKGYNPGPIDGVHGPRTSAALRDYQKAEGLKVTGEMDAETRAKLMASGPTSPAASPATTPASPSTVGSPSAKPAAPEKVEKK